MLVAQTTRGPVRMPEGILGFLGKSRPNKRALGQSFWDDLLYGPPGYRATIPANIAGVNSAPTPSSSGLPSDVLFNMRTGNVSPAQATALQQQETEQLIQAGMDPADAATQAASDVNASLSTFSGTGGLGISWTGAGPSSPSLLDASLIGAGSANSPFGLSLGEWLLIGALVVAGIAVLK